MPLFDTLYRDVRPPGPMHRMQPGKLGIVRDMIHKHGQQALELRSLEKKGREITWKFFASEKLRGFGLVPLQVRSSL